MKIKDIIKQHKLQNKKVLVTVKLQGHGFAGYYDWVNNKYQTSPLDNNDSWEIESEQEVITYELAGPIDTQHGKYDENIIVIYRV